MTLHDHTRHVHREVNLEPFEIGTYPVTRELLAESLSEYRDGDLFDPRHPASDISWFIAVRF